MRWRLGLRRAAWMAGALCALALGALAGSAPPAALSQASEVRPLRVADRLEVGGAPLELSVFFTADPPERVVAFYGAAVQRQGIVPLLAQEQKLSTVSAFDPDGRLLRTITAFRASANETLVISSSFEAQSIPRLLAGASKFGLPLPPRSRAVFALRGVDGDSTSETAHFVSPLPAKDVLEFFRGELGKAGFRAGAAGAGHAELERGAERVSVAVQPLGASAGAAVFVAHTGGSPE